MEKVGEEKVGGIHIGFIDELLAVISVKNTYKLHFANRYIYTF